jgi:hypothetical protein
MGAMTENETMIRKAYKIADEQDVAGWAGCFKKMERSQTSRSA